MTIINTRLGDFSTPDRNDLIPNAMRIYGEWAQLEIEVLGKFIRPGSTVVDVGAFIGTHSRAFSQLVGREGKVYAFEPNPESWKYLQENAKLALYSNIKCYELGLGEQQSAALIPTQVSENMGACRMTSANADSSDHAIQIRRLDDMCLGRIDFIKADIEGMEFNMLLGAEETIKQYHPTLFLEVNTLQESYPILAWAKTSHYVLLGLISNAFNPDNFNRVNENIFGGASEVGLILVHREKLDAEDAFISHMSLPIIDSLDSLSLLLLHKQQYFREVLEVSHTSEILGVDFISPLSQVLSVQLDARNKQYDVIRKELAEKNKELAEKNKELNNILRSRSWRFTKPLRLLTRLIR